MEISKVVEPSYVLNAAKNNGELATIGKILELVKHGAISLDSEGTLTVESNGETFKVPKLHYILIKEIVAEDGNEFRVIYDVVEDLDDYLIISIDRG